jgi:hypothetical protein
MPRPAPSLTVYGTNGPDDTREAARWASHFGVEFPDRPAGQRHGCVYEGRHGNYLVWWTEARGLAAAKSQRAGEGNYADPS